MDKTISFENLSGYLPEGPVKALIDSAEIKLTRAGTGEILALAMTVFGSSRAGAKLFCNIILSHPKEGAVFYGQKLLKSLLGAVGIDTSGEKITLNPDELVGKRILAVVTVKDSEGWGKQNEVVRFEACPDDDASEADTESIPF